MSWKIIGEWIDDNGERENVSKNEIEFTEEQSVSFESRAREFFNNWELNGKLLDDFTAWLDAHTKKLPMFPCPGCNKETDPIKLGSGYRGVCMNPNCEVYQTHWHPTKQELSQALKDLQ